MALRLTVRGESFRDHVRHVANEIANLVPVIKGNGYGLGRAELVRIVDELLPHTTTIAVGTIHEALDVPDRFAVHVMNPIGSVDLISVKSIPSHVMPTIGSTRDVDVLRGIGWKGRVVVKLGSSMRRFGVSHSDFSDLVRDVERIGGVVHACSIHLPLAGDDRQRLAEIDRWLPFIPECVSLSVSHLSADSLAALQTANTQRTFEVRLGTALWHGTKSHFALEADVVRTEPCSTNETAGYRASPIIGQGTLVVVGAGTAHGVTPLPDGTSPFHFGRQRMALVEPPYMHSAIAFVPEGSPCPQPGDMVDVQRPLTMVHPDVVTWS